MKAARDSELPTGSLNTQQPSWALPAKHNQNNNNKRPPPRLGIFGLNQMLPSNSMFHLGLLLRNENRQLLLLIKSSVY